MTVVSPPPRVPAAATRSAVPFARDLARHGDRLAVVAGAERWTYRELAQRVAATADRLGGGRKLVLVSGANDVAQLVTYLAALAAGHVALLVPPAQAGAVAAAYDPDAVLDGGELDVRRPESAHDLHPELALLMPTSGSTGSPKLARLSHENVQANAESIVASLGIQDTDRAVTTLPLHYVYGLSVVNTHLLRGAAVVLTDLSVADACFWDLFKAEGGTTLAGVPHTFDLLDRVGFAGMRLPRLRSVTQAGGRLSPEQVVRYAELGRRGGWDFVVMYGQTEATARMAYLPPELAAEHPSTVGVAIPGGSFSLSPVPEAAAPGVGELVYEGPNVMLGYATSPADLALGRTVTALRTGDLARRTPDGLIEIVGRRSRFVKIAGLRVDLDHVEAELSGPGRTVRCTGADGELLVAVAASDAEADAVRGEIVERYRLPAHAVTVAAVSELPRLANGKVDLPALAVLVRAATAPVPPPAVTEPLPERLRALYAELLGRPDATLDSTFVGLGGDSLSYVELSIRLEEALGAVPADWHVTPIRALAAGAAGSADAVRVRWWARRVETTAALRALAIVCVVATHAGLFTLQGGAHVLVAAAGFNFARFRLTSADRLTRLRQQAVSLARVVVPSVLWIGAVVALTDQYGPLNVALLNGLFGAPTWTPDWHFWFVEVLVYILVVLAALLALPPVDRLERRFPFAFPVVLLGVGLLGRYEIVDLGVPHTMPVFWLFAFGWAAARASRWWQRLALTAVLALTVPGFFGNSARELAIVAGIALLLWCATVPCPAPLQRAVSVLASASLYIYLTHWQIYPRLVDVHPAVAVGASLVAGALLWWLASRATALAVSRPGRAPLRR